MSLTPEERRRIYEEEKTRIEAQEQIRTEVAAKAGEMKNPAQADVGVKSGSAARASADDRASLTAGPKSGGVPARLVIGSCIAAGQLLLPPTLANFVAVLVILVALANVIQPFLFRSRWQAAMALLIGFSMAVADGSDNPVVATVLFTVGVFPMFVASGRAKAPRIGLATLTTPPAAGDRRDGGKSRPTYAEIRKMLAARHASVVRPLPGKLRRALMDNLAPGEPVEVSLNPATGQAVVVTDRRVLIIKAGGYWTGAGWFAARSKSFPFAEISSVDLRVGPLGGHLKISVAGTPQAPDVGIQPYDMMKVENAITFDVVYKDAMKIVADVIRGKVESAHSGASNSPARDLVAQLSDLTHLRDTGVLTEAEFATAKARLLTER